MYTRLNELSPTTKGLATEIRTLAATNSDSVLLEMLKAYAPAWLVGLLAAGILSAVMGSDCHQILGLSTMFTKDLIEYYGHADRMGPRGTVFLGRLFIVVLNGLAYLIALSKPAIFELAVTYAFAGFASMSPVMIAGLFWKRSTKYGEIAVTVWVAVCVVFQLIMENYHPQANHILLVIGDSKILFMTAQSKLSFMGYTTVVPMVIGSAILMGVVSLLTRLLRNRRSRSISHLRGGRRFCRFRSLDVNIAILAAGAGGMYCGSCMRDNALASSLRRLGHQVSLVPLYTPLKSEADDATTSGIFYGGINVYLQHVAGLFRHTPRAVDWLLDRPWLLNVAGNLGVQTPPRKVAGLTASIFEAIEGLFARNCVG